MAKKQFIDGSKVIEVKSLDFMGKDIIQIQRFEDFAWLVGTGVVFKLHESYYSISDTVAYVWVDE